MDDVPLSHPLSIRAVARYWKMDRSKTATIIERLPGAIWYGSKVAIPVTRMPVEYLVDAGIVSVDDVLKLSANQSQSHLDRDSTGVDVDDNSENRKDTYASSRDFQRRS